VQQKLYNLGLQEAMRKQVKKRTKARPMWSSIVSRRKKKESQGVDSVEQAPRESSHVNLHMQNENGCSPPRTPVQRQSHSRYLSKINIP